MAPRLTIALLFVALISACTPSRRVLLNTGEGTPFEYRPPTSNRSVEVDEDDFEGALALLLLQEPLAIRTTRQGWLVRTSSLGDTPDAQLHSLMRKSFGGMCRPGQPKTDCLSLLDDVMGMSPTDKMVVALGLSIDPMRERVGRAMKDTLSPQFFTAAIGAGLVTWAFLAANLEPVFTFAAQQDKRFGALFSPPH